MTKIAIGCDHGAFALKEEMKVYLADKGFEVEDNFETVHDKLGMVGAGTLLRTVEALRAGTLTATPQEDSLSTYAAKIEKSDCLIDFSADAHTVHNRIRGLSPIPVALTHTPDGKLLKIPAAVPSALPRPVGAQNGEILSLDGGVITVACGDGTLALTRVTPEGKRPMAAADYIRGRNVKVGDVLG